MSIFLEIQTKVFSMKQNDVKICFRLLQQKKEEEKRDKDGCPGPDRVCVALVASDRLYFRS